MDEEDGGSGGARQHLERSRRVWDRRSEAYARSESELAPMREDAIERLDLQPGDRVLDVGCGPGTNFQALRGAVGPEGEIVGIDYSPKMVERAQERVAEAGWENVAVRRADATTADLGVDYDVAVATLSLSVMPDVPAAVANVHGALAPGGRLAVFDLRPIPTGPARVVNPLLRRFFRWYANWNPDGDVPAALESTFAECEVVNTYALGAGYTAIATRGARP